MIVVVAVTVDMAYCLVANSVVAVNIAKILAVGISLRKWTR